MSPNESAEAISPADTSIVRKGELGGPESGIR